MSPEKALNTLAGLCSNKEYCSHDIREKLIKWEISAEKITHIMKFLYEHHFIDDSRFAISYASDKFRFNKWGKQKIFQMLRQKDIPSNIIADALSRLEQDEYDNICLTLLKEKLKMIKCNDPLQTKGKLFRFAAGRGFDYDTISRTIMQLTGEACDESDERT